jgi:lipoprotein-releasing system ATP-binding protein
MSEPLIQASGITKTFISGGTKLEVLKGIELDVFEGERIGIFGPSGSGKTTLLYILSFLDRPTSGNVKIEGQDLSSLDDQSLSRFRRDKIGFVFQFYNLLPEFTALENVMLPGLIKGLNKGEARKRAEKLLEEVGLQRRLSHRPDELSGGEQQRVAVARALMNNPKIIFADEPTGNLDRENTETLMELFLKLNREKKMTLLVVSHNLELIPYFTKVYRLIDGRLEIDENSKGK